MDRVLTRDTAVLLIDWLSAYDMAALARTSRTMRDYVAHFLRTRVQRRIPFPTTPKGLLCLWAEIRGDVGERPRTTHGEAREYAFTATGLARMVKAYGKNYAPPPNSSVGRIAGYERYPLSLIRTQYDPDIHAMNLKTKLSRRRTERLYRRKARGLLKKPLHRDILSLITTAHNNQCWVTILRRLHEKKRPTNAEVRKVERYGGVVLVDAFMACRIVTRLHLPEKTRVIIKRDDVRPWMDRLIDDWINADPGEYIPRSLDTLLTAIARRRTPIIDEWIEDAKEFFTRMESFEGWPLLERMKRAVEQIDTTLLARRHTDFPPLNIYTLTRFACIEAITAPQAREGDDVLDRFMDARPDEPRMRGVGWDTIPPVMHSIGLGILDYFELSDKELAAAREVVRRTPGITHYLSSMEEAELPKENVDASFLSFICRPFIAADQSMFHPWAVLKAITVIAREINEAPDVKAAKILLKRHQRRNADDDDDDRAPKRRRKL